MRERAEAYRATRDLSAKGGTQRSTTTESAHRASDRITSYVIDGSRNPELFLPHELFDQLMTGLMPDEALARKQREYYGPGIRSFGLDEREFWERVERVAGHYARTRYGVPSAELDTNDVAVCRARYEALKSVRQAFGYEQFNQFLYSVIAPTMRFSAATNSADPSAALMRVEGGCQ